MKCLVIFSIFLYTLCIACSKNSNKQDAGHIPPQNKLHFSDTLVTQKHEILFNDSAPAPICKRIPTDITPDSLTYSSTKIDGVIYFIQKHQMNLSSCKVLQEKYSSEYNKFLICDYGFKIASTNNSYFSIGSKHIFDSTETQNIVIAYLTLYTLFSLGKKICNILMIDSITPTVLRDRSSILTFSDGTILTVSSQLYSDLQIDSVATFNKSLLGTFESCGKSIIDINNYTYLKSYNPNLYKEIAGITTAVSISSNNKQYYFSIKKDSTACSIPSGSPVKIAANIFELFSRGKLLSNVLIIDSIRANKN